MYDLEMGIFVHGRVCRGALVVAVLIGTESHAAAAAGGASTGSDASTMSAGGNGGGGTAATDAGIATTPDGGPIVDTGIDSGCGCRMSGSTNDVRLIGLVVGLVALAKKRKRCVRGERHGQPDRHDK